MNDISRSLNSRTLLSYLFLALALLSLCVTSYTILNEVLRLPIPFDTDEADHANAGIELFFALQSGDLSTITSAITRQAFYPPVHSFFVAAAYALKDISVQSSRLPSLFFFILTSLSLGAATFSAARSLQLRTSSACIGSAAALLCISGSRITAENAALCMLELCGVFFTALTVHLCIKEKRSPLLIALSLAIVMLTKYSFGLILIPGVLVGIAAADSHFRLSKQNLLRSIYAGAALLGVLLLWFVSSDKAAIIHFFIGHPQYAPLLSSENLLFDIRSWLFDYSNHFSTSLLIIIFSVLAISRFRRNQAVRAAAGTVLFALIILTISTTNESRHFMVAAPALWFLGALGCAEIAEKFSERPAVFALVMPFLFLPFFYSGYTLPQKLPAYIAREMEGQPQFAELQDAIFSVVDCSQPALFIGVSDQFGIEALRWKGAEKCKMPYTDVRFDTFPYRDDKNMTARKRKRNLDMPYSEPLFPKEPVEAVIETGYYKTIVLIREVGARGLIPSLIKFTKTLLAEKQQIQFTVSGKEVTVVIL